MPTISCLHRGWSGDLAKLLSSAKREVVISSPFITREGVVFVHEHLSRRMRKGGDLRLITNLSPSNVVQGITDPHALKFLADRLTGLTIWHLPRLHAKVYIADAASAIVTSANLTNGGLIQNYEYGLYLAEDRTVRKIKEEVTAYGNLGACLSAQELSRYVAVSDQVRAAFQLQQRTISRTAKAQFERLFFAAENDLVALRISGASQTRVFERTIEYLLARHGAMTTPELHLRVADIHPDLCDNSIDRVIKGQRFGKKWKHAVRTAQTHLKGANQIELVEGRWRIARQAQLAK